jgi:2-oxoglutarate dehydrogenase E2 component (dihydrolipoamide succinyltransferase)
MAVLEVKVPQLSESVAEATLLQWHKKVGEQVSADENLIEIETDKVVLELPSPGKGVITQIYKNEGEIVVAGEIIALIDSEAAPTVVDADNFVTTSATAEQSQAAPSGSSAGVAMPAAARMMAENGLAAGDVTGTGKGERVTKGDVIKALEERAQMPAVKPSKPEMQPVAAPLSIDRGNRPEDRVPMSRLRARIAERLVQSQQTNASLTTFNEVNMQPVIDLRKKYSSRFEQEHGVRLGFMSFFIKAVVAALKKYPIVNASIDENDIVYHGYFDIGIAISSPRGLVVPIMRDVDLMSIADIEKKIGELSARAKDGQLTLDDLTGGTFSISNGGVFGSMLSTPIINPPQSAILGVHATKDRAVVENGQIVIRPMNYLALSYDHRLIDGREAVMALVTIKEMLEDPARLLLDV